MPLSLHIGTTWACHWYACRGVFMFDWKIVIPLYFMVQILIQLWQANVYPEFWPSWGLNLKLIPLDSKCIFWSMHLFCVFRISVIESVGTPEPCKSLHSNIKITSESITPRRNNSPSAAHRWWFCSLSIPLLSKLFLSQHPSAEVVISPPAILQPYISVHLNVSEAVTIYQCLWSISLASATAQWGFHHYYIAILLLC